MQLLMEDSQLNSISQSHVFSIRKIKNQKKWTKEEDELLIQLAEKYSEKNWKEISKRFIKKNSLQCFSRYKRIRPGIIKGSWKKDEDLRIMELVSQYGKSWSKISKILGTRNGKQIRDRYINVLDPEIKKGKFTEEEDEMLIQLFHEHGPKWAAIAKYYPNRTADMVKNRFHSSIKKRLGVDSKTDTHKKVYEKELLQFQAQRQGQGQAQGQTLNQRIDYYESPYAISKTGTSASVKTLAKPEPKAEVQKLYHELQLQEEQRTQLYFNNENYEDDEGNMNNFFANAYNNNNNNNPFDFMKIENPITSKDDLEWNFDDFFIYN